MRKHYPLNSNGAEDAGQLPWKDGVPSTGVEGSYPGQALFVDAEAEILAAIDAAGLVRSGSDLAQLVQAIARGIYLGQYAGSANTLAAAIPNGVVFSSLQRGTRLTGFVTSTNTAGVTVTITGIGVSVGVVQAALLRRSGTALQAGDLPVGQDFEIRWDGSAFRMIGTVTSDAGGGSSGAAGILGYAYYDSAGTLSITPPSGATRALAKAWGGSGGGGGSLGSPLQGGGGGGGGGYAAGLITGLSSSTAIPITIGAAGMPGAANSSSAAGSGGTTSFGSYLSATGGLGGNALNTAGAGGAAGTGSGGQVYKTGGAGGIGNNQAGGAGGAAPFGGSCSATGSTPGNGPGGGGTGAPPSGYAGYVGSTGALELLWLP